MHLGRVFGVATGAYFGQVTIISYVSFCLSHPKGSGVGKTLNMRLSIGGHLETEAKHIIDLHPLFIVEAGGIGKL